MEAEEALETREQLPPSRRATGSKPRLLAVTAERSAYSLRVEGGVRGGCAEAPGLDDERALSGAPADGVVRHALVVPLERVVSLNGDASSTRKR